MKSIKFAMQDNEKELLDKLAKANHTTVSAFVRDCIQKQLPKDAEIEVPAEETDKDQMVNIRVVITKQEYEQLKKRAGVMPISAYVRNVILPSLERQFVFDIKTDDLEELNRELSNINLHMEGFIGALRFRKDLQNADVARFEQLLEQTNKAVINLEREIINNRKAIRSEAIRSLRRKVKRITGKER